MFGSASKEIMLCIFQNHRISSSYSLLRIRNYATWFWFLSASASEFESICDSYTQNGVAITTHTHFIKHTIDINIYMLYPAVYANRAGNLHSKYTHTHSHTFAGRQTQRKLTLAGCFSHPCHPPCIWHSVGTECEHIAFGNKQTHKHTEHAATHPNAAHSTRTRSQTCTPRAAEEQTNTRTQPNAKRTHFANGYTAKCELI